MVAVAEVSYRGRYRSIKLIIARARALSSRAAVGVYKLRRYRTKQLLLEKQLILSL